MIEVMTVLPDRVLGLRATGKVSAEDYKTVLVPASSEDTTTRSVGWRFQWTTSDTSDNS